MTKLSDWQVLQKAIELAVKEGYLIKDGKLQDIIFRDWDNPKVPYDRYTFLWQDKKGKPYSAIFDSYMEIIFSHQFAKALWGEELVCLHGKVMKGLDSECNCAWEGGIKIPAFHYHLQTMVLYENPLEYLREWLERREE